MGDVVISIDAELAWGYHDLESAPDRIDDAREGWRAALRLLATHDVPATWGTVGHLLLEKCDATHGDHPLGQDGIHSMGRPWFPCRADRAGSDDWHAPEMVDAVASADQDHEIASHTFSHVVMSDVDRAVADAEIAASIDAAEEVGLDMESLVYPRNAVAHRDVLATRGLRCYRGARSLEWYEDSALRPLLKLADWSSIGTQPPIVTPTVDEHGLVNVPASLYLFSFEGPARRAARLLGHQPVVSVAKRGIDRAVDADGVFHMWFHPHNLLQPDGVERLDVVLEYLNRRRAETDLSVRTMIDVANEVLDERELADDGWQPVDEKEPSTVDGTQRETVERVEADE